MFYIFINHLDNEVKCILNISEDKTKVSDVLERIQQENTNVIKQPEHLSYEESLRVGPIQLKEETQEESYKYLNGEHKENRASLFSVMPVLRQEAMGMNWNPKFYTSITNFFTAWMTKH